MAKKLQLVLDQKKLNQLIKNTVEFDKEYPIECRRETGNRYLFVNENRLKILRRVNIN